VHDNSNCQLRFPGIDGTLPADRPHAQPELQIRVALRLAHLYGLEADDLQYAWPQAEGWQTEHAALQAAGNATLRRANPRPRALHERAWQHAVESFGNPRLGR
jgi:hypothetical protein